ncbi:MAG: Uma2 family endonuclease [Chloroflexota bacterium]
MAIRHLQPKRWTYDDLLALPDDGKRYEIIEGELVEMPSPGAIHQIILMNLALLLGPIVRLLGGRPLAAPLDVFMPLADPVQPDFAVLLPGGAARISPRGIEGPPDLVVEVLSPSSARRDIVTKREVYRRGGVREYWIVDPTERAVTVIHAAPDGQVRESRFSDGSRLISPLLPGADLPLAAIFADLDGIDDLADLADSNSPGE